MAKLLVAEDEEGVREFLAEALELDGHDVTAVADGEAAMAALKREAFHVLLTDLKMPRASGIDVLRHARAECPETRVVVLTAHGSVDAAVEAMKLGAYDFIQKPLSSPAELRLLVARALEHRSLADRDEQRTRETDERELPLTYGAASMRPVVEALRKVAKTTATVLLTGESGTGKEVAARAVHRWSPRASGPFVAVNCAALTESLLESELFGHEKGAFTGATSRRRGRIELADGGTFFLDEVGELKPDLQAKLLRVLQERRFERLGGAQSIESDVRWVAATNRDLHAMIAEGTFREDLYHRLAVFPIRLPPLRERREDLLPLAELLLERVGAELGRPGLRLDDAAQRQLAAAPFSGNIRELRNTLERAVILADDDVITPAQLWLEPAPGAGGSVAPAAASAAPAPGGAIKPLSELERDAIVAALASVDGNRREAAELLGIGVRTLYDKLKKYELG